MASAATTPPSSKSVMDNRTVVDVEKCLTRVLKHLKEGKDGGGSGRQKALFSVQEDQQQWSSQDLLQEVLPIVLFFLDMEPLTGLAADSPAAPPLGLVPLRMQNELSLPVAQRMRRLALDLLHALTRTSDRSELFPLWVVVLPGSPHSPYQVSLIERLATVDQGAQPVLAHIISDFLDKVDPFLKFVEQRRSACLSFTPMYASLGEALEKAHDSLISSCLAASNFHAVSSTIRALSSLVRHCPYRRLGFEPLRKALDLARKLISAVNGNPVSRIAGLNLHAAVMLLDCAGQVLSREDECRQLYVPLVAGEARVSGPTGDNNLRYVALQNLGQLAAKHIGVLSENAPSLTSALVANLRERDTAVVLHSLRLAKLIAKNDPSRTSATADEGAGDAGRVISPFSELWSVLLRPKCFQAVSGRNDDGLEAALCDLISELGETAFSGLTADQRFLCVSFILSRSGDGQDDSADAPRRQRPASSVKSSALRAIGLLLGHRSLRDDLGFLSDCTAKVVTVLESASPQKRPSSSARVEKEDRASLTCATWALASLAEALLELHESPCGSGGDSGIDGDIASSKTHVLELLAILASFDTPSALFQNNVVARVNVLRASGCLVLCLDSSYLSGDADADASLSQIASQALDAILEGILTADVVKVRWNACHAAGRVFCNAFVVEKLTQEWQSRACQALSSAFAGSQNFKVKIAAASALSKIETADVLNAHRIPIMGSLLRELEKVEEGGDDEGVPVEEEAKHRVEWADSAVLLLCHLLVTAADRGDELCQAAETLSRDALDNLRFVVGRVRRRISPERARALDEAAICLSAAAEADSGRRLDVLKQIFVDAEPSVALVDEEEEEEEEGDPEDI